MKKIPAPATLNRLRAAVLGSNDGIVSVAGIIAGVAGATDARPLILTAGLAGIVAGAVSMAAGEYVSVSSQRDSERSHGVAKARQVSPWQAAAASALSFLGGAVIPFVATILAPKGFLIPVLLVATILALTLTGYLGAYFGNANKRHAVLRVVIGGMIAVIVTYAIGSVFHIA